MPDDDMLTVDEVAELFGVNRKTIIRWADKGGLPYLRDQHDGRRKFRRSEIEPMLPREGEE